MPGLETEFATATSPLTKRELTLSEDNKNLNPSLLRVIKRNGSLVNYDPNKIRIAVSKAFLAVEGHQAVGSSRIHEKVSQLTDHITETFQRRMPSGGILHIEDIQDQVELALMRESEHKVARSYVLYREDRRQQRLADEKNKVAEIPPIFVTLKDGKRSPLNIKELNHVIQTCCQNLLYVDANLILKESLRNLYDGIPDTEVDKALIISTRPLVERDPNYSFVTARLLLNSIKKEAHEFLDLQVAKEAANFYPSYFTAYLEKGISCELLSSELKTFDWKRLSQAIKPSRDLQFTYLGLQTLYDRYLIHANDIRFELPQAFFMRVAMGLALKESDKDKQAIAFYELLSSFNYMASTPTLFNSGTLRPQLSSCFLTTIPDDLDAIYSAIKDNALLSKFAGGLGNDWTPVRALGAKIKGTNGKSLGVVPFLNVANASAVAVNQGGKRKGAVCAYLETWHLDIEEFLELRKNTGDDRRRTHDMNTANWVPDLFMQRVMEGLDWTLFSPDEVPELHNLCGQTFEKIYCAYEEKAKRGDIVNFKVLPALTLWRKMLSLLFETGHPWITFKDACNLRSPQQHQGIIHSSNLCTEITLNTSEQEIAVCNLGSINLPQHLTDTGDLDTKKLQQTIRTAMRMLDNVIDINYYTVPQARRSNLKHRPIGLGIMGFQDALYQLRIRYDSQAAVDFSDKSMELISYYAIDASSDLAAEKGKYESFEGSLWSQGILPIDSIKLLEKSRGKYLEQDKTTTLDWAGLRHKIKMQGMRNSNCMAIAPTATISNICGISQSIEPTYQNLFVKSNMSGEFTIINPYLIRDLRKLDLWDSVMVNDLKYYDGSVQRISRIPNDLKNLYATAFEIEAKWLVEAGSRRQKWLDQSQSLNLYMATPSGKKLDELYKFAWLKGLKTTYYLRTMGATHTEKSTVEKNTLNAVPRNTQNNDDKTICSLDDSGCESCQ